MRLMFRKWFVFGGISAALIAAVVASVYLVNRPAKIPQDFLDARSRGAQIAQEINSFADSASASLDEISKKDSEGDYTQALDLTLIEIKRAREAKDKSIELLGELQKMTAAITDIDSEELQQTAMQAVSTEVSLVGKLIEYNDDLNQLLDNMRLKFVSYSPTDYNKDTETITRRINEKALQINEMSRKYHALMREFDDKSPK